MSSNLDNTIKKVLADDRSDENDVRSATAAHQRDFPYDREEEAQVTRREFCNFLGLTSAALFVGAAGFAGKAAIDARQTRVFLPYRVEGGEGLAPGFSLNFHYPSANDSAILVRTLDGELHAFGQKCTHLACPVYFERAHQRLECPCHDGAFDARTGNVLYGPPPRPLDPIKLEVRANGEVWAIGREASSGEHSS
ncbi:MAG TPA: Rieske (2Fe-2S) protein [Pyrinomonadaceae bacterium]|nr:Rieske (2Fe-2S) protein [Pyrinomonadaceae bacterium]